MSRPGVSYQDLLPIPDDTAPVTEPGKRETAQSLADAPTLSHALAMDDHEEKGVAQLEHADDEVVDLGWNEPKPLIAAPLVGGMDNEELWMLIRRFNKQMYHVKEYPHPVPGNLDLNIADEEEFSPDKLRANIERLYMTVAYFVAWTFDFLVPLMVSTLIALIVYPPARDILFPPAPIALVDSSTGGVQKPKAGILGSHDSATGAPENHKGEAVEQEASNFVNGIASVALSSATGKHPQTDPAAEDGSAEDTAPDPTAIALGAANAKDTAAGTKPGAEHDKTKVPMETAMWTKMRPIMHGIADVTDTWERFANALSPTPPFPQDTYRLRLSSVVVPLLAVSLFVSSYMSIKGVTFGVGFGFFGDPVIQRGLELLNRRFPHWQRLLELRNTLLKGVPTNAQLTITLLRIGEANNAPLPPPPRIGEAPPDAPAQVTDEHLRATGADWPLNATQEELDAAIAQHDPKVPHQTGGPDIDASKNASHGKKGSRVLNFFKGTTKATVETAIGADKLKAKTGSDRAKDRLGVVPKAGEDLTSGPVEFKCRYHGHKGHLYISAKATIPCLSFSTDSTIEKIGTVDREDLHPVWSVPVAEIMEMKKVGGYGWKAKLVVGWALGRQVADGLEITERKGSVWKVTACPLRDELFNRLVAMGGQKWESW
ncbi:hypothetical protein K490DRAFT_57606 [Saccharata proteae CBS 121410]|uniref:Uncharacterized protein n=1 Tax=Saccharata proteae CBS 121410 TaxID=1314787 RepID=A0A9P4HUD9_9PEZI|nr:hypothetical protein K490DRAFT_57606 [Saccharata proteae CBS 121410]